MTNADKARLEQLAAEKILKARAALAISRKFYGVLIANVKTQPCWQIPTMGTDSKTHYYNPGFIAGLEQQIVEGVQAHESEHDARHHSTRRRGRDIELWNRACDFSINGDLLKQGFKLPSDILFREDLVGMASEDIYRILQIEERQQQQETPEGDGESDDEPEADDESQGAGDDEGEDDTGQDDDASDDGKSDDSDDEGQGNEAGDGDESEGDESEGEGDGQGEGESEGDGEGQGSGTGDADSEGEAEATPTSCGQGGGVGEVFDAPGTEAEVADLDAKWQVITHQAAALAAKAGTVPAHWATLIEKRKTATQDWRAVLREYIDAGARQTQTWNRPNRRFAHSGLVLPGNMRDGVNKVAFIVDTSGSMWWRKDAFTKIANEVQAAIDDGAISEAIVVYADTRITRVDRYVDGDQIEFDPKGGGGTDMMPAFAWVNEEEPDASLIVCLTDLELIGYSEEPTQPVLWCAYNDPRMIAALTPPWGKVLDVNQD